MKIQIQKNDVCPICSRKITKKNCWVRYHVSYSPQLVVLACKYCNFAEYGLRTGAYLTRRAVTREPFVLAFKARFNLIM